MTTMTNIVEIKLDDIQASTSGNIQSWIQVITLGKYKHPDYGKIVFTPDRLQKFADSVNNRVTGIQPDIDYDHKAKIDYAAGWIEKAEVREDGLWALVEWTPKAAQAIKDKEYKYFSPEFVDSWTDPKTQQKFTDVLRGGAITNRPFLKDIAQLQLSEGNLMDEATRKELAEALGLDPASVTDEEINTALADNFMKKKKEAAAAGAKCDEDGGEDNSAGTDASKLSENEKSKLLNDPATAKLVSVMEMQAKQLSEQAKKFKEMEVSSTIAKLSETAAKSNKLIPGAVKDKLVKLFSETDSTVTSKVANLISDIITVGFAPTGEIGNNSSDSGVNSDSVKKFSDKVNSLMEEKKLSYKDAAIMAAENDPQLFLDYRNNSYAE